MRFEGETTYIYLHPVCQMLFPKTSKLTLMALIEERPVLIKYAAV